MVWSEVQNVAICSNRWRVAREVDPVLSAELFDGHSTIAAWDGQSGLFFTHDKALGTMVPDLGGLARFLGIAFPGHEYTRYLMRWITTDTGVSVNRDLVALLSDPATVVRGEPESVSGFDCWVLDHYQGDTVICTVWVAPACGYLPLRQVHGDQEELVIDDVVQVLPGVFMPASGRRITPVGVLTMQVVSNDEGVLDIKVGPNQPLLASLFEGLPAGARIVDPETQTQTIVMGDDTAARARELVRRLGADQQLPSEHGLNQRIVSGVVGDPRESSYGSFAAVASVGLVLGTAIGVAGWRRSMRDRSSTAKDSSGA